MKRNASLALFVTLLTAASLLAQAETVNPREPKVNLQSEASDSGSTALPVNAVNLPVDADGHLRVVEQRDPKSVTVTNFPATQDVRVVNAASARWQLVGFTTAALFPVNGVFALTRECQAEFPGSRFCTLREVRDTTSIPALPSGTWAWVDPAGFPAFQSGTVNYNCGGWRDVGAIGTIVDSAGRIDADHCRALDGGLEHSLACCGLVAD